MPHSWLGLLTLITATLVALPARAQSAEQSLALAVHALSFLPDYADTTLRVGLVVDPANADSIAEARSIEQAAGNGLKAGNFRLAAVEIPVADLDSVRDVDIYWITTGLRAFYPKITQVAIKRQKLTASSDLDCAQEQICVLGVRAYPSIKIILSSAAAMRCGIAFQPAFRMMVTER